MHVSGGPHREPKYHLPTLYYIALPYLRRIEAPLTTFCCQGTVVELTADRKATTVASRT